MIDEEIKIEQTPFLLKLAEGPATGRQLAWIEGFKTGFRPPSALVMSLGSTSKTAKADAVTRAMECADLFVAAFDDTFPQSQRRPVTQADLDAIADAANAGGGFDAEAVEEFADRTTVSDFAFVDGANTGTMLADEAEPALSTRQHVWLAAWDKAIEETHGIVYATPSKPSVEAFAKARADACLAAFDAAFPPGPVERLADEPSPGTQVTEVFDKKTADGFAVFIGQQLHFAHWDGVLGCPWASSGSVFKGEFGPVVILKYGRKVDPALCYVDPLAATYEAWKKYLGPVSQGGL